MNPYLRHLLAAGACAALILFIAQLGGGGWQRALITALIGGFVFGSLVAQLMVLWQHRRQQKNAKKTDPQHTNRRD
ncbi:hypothetical protein [Desulfuromonas thiophila]|uniref:hypothetical protein n=1 Tax=Desulfuromonas thiophila TaxID=57664 RepID=UPI0029F5901E|nr:hypothetical protein [Desulfuromonas thiophila]